MQRGLPMEHCVLLGLAPMGMSVQNGHNSDICELLVYLLQWIDEITDNGINVTILLEQERRLGSQMRKKSGNHLYFLILPCTSNLITLQESRMKKLILWGSTDQTVEKISHL